MPITPIAAAVEPLRTDAIRSAGDYTRQLIAKMVRTLEDAGLDLNVAAPRPNSNISRPDYRRLLARHDAFLSFTRPAVASRHWGTPDIRIVVAELIERQVALAEEAASAEYTAFIAKLESKVGEHSAATLEGNHVWGRSVLTVTTPSGVERWMTQQIVNVSKLGKVFPQWPSRKQGRALVEAA